MKGKQKTGVAPVRREINNYNRWVTKEVKTKQHTGNLEYFKDHTSCTKLLFMSYILV